MKLLRNRIGRIVVLLFVAIIVISVTAVVLAYIVPLPERLGRPGSRVIEYADGSTMNVSLSSDEMWRVPVSLDNVEPRYIEALLKYEDKRFYKHPGFDPIALARAFVQNVRAGRVVSGASTITMQLVRMLEPRPRTVASKFVEILRSMQLELRMSKRKILEAYLTFLPFGKNVEGVESASLCYFGHRARDLSPHEIAYLLSVPQDPTGRYPSGPNATAMPDVIEHVAGRLRDAGVFSDDQFREAADGPILTAMTPFPRDAMHVAQMLFAINDATTIRSVIRRDAQAVTKHAIESARAEYARMGIHNASAVVIDNETGEVVAAVGNFDFWDDEHSGQVVGFQAPRSPGSSMKPFIYAIGIDRSIVLPEYLVPDVPVRYAGYEPINYDRRFRGLVKLEDALAVSLNIPFVMLLQRIGVRDYIGFLRQCGITTLVDDPGYYGLSMAIGGVEIRLSELTAMYAMLARGGEYIHPHWTLSDEPVERYRVLSPGATYLTRRALRIRNRPDFPGGRFSKTSPRLFWKTGTSAGHKDAWAIGGARRYSAGIWVGNFDGAPSNYLVGSERAGVILFDLLEALEPDSSDTDGDEMPPDLMQIEVCALSGRPAGTHCPHVVGALAIASHIPTEKCPYHVEYWTDRETGERLTPTCRAGHDAEPRTFTIFPSNVRRWVSENSFQSSIPPPLAADCNRVAGIDRGMRIVSPKPEAVYFLVPGLRADQQEIPLEADAGAGTGEVHWFVDDRFLSSGPPHERTWLTPEPGRHKVRVVDSNGHDDTVHINILTPGQRPHP